MAKDRAQAELAKLRQALKKEREEEGREVFVKAILEEIKGLNAQTNVLSQIAGSRTPLLMLPSWVPGWIQSLLDLVMPMVPALHIPGLEELVRLRDIIEKRFDHPVVSPEARQLAEDCSFVVIIDEPVLASKTSRKRKKKQVPSGMGFFYGPKSALSCAHILPEASLQEGPVVTAMEKDARSPTGMCEITLTVRDFDVELDWVRLTVSSKHPFMPTFSGAATELVGAPLGLCSFHVSLHRELGEPLSSLGVMPGRGIHVSHNARHLLYECPAWPGDSGAALILYKGQIAAMHQEGVNSVREVIRQREVSAYFTIECSSRVAAVSR